MVNRIQGKKVVFMAVSGFCEDPGVPENGFRIGNDLSRGGSGVLYICNNGFSISGIERSMCRLDGTWSSPVPQCGEFKIHWWSGILLSYIDRAALIHVSLFCCWHASGIGVFFVI